MLKLQIDQSQPGICFHKSICAALNGWNDMMWMTFEWRFNDMWRAGSWAGSWEGELEELGHRTRHLLHGIPVKLPCPGLSWDQLRTCHMSHIKSYQVISSHVKSYLIKSHCMSSGYTLHDLCFFILNRLNPSCLASRIGLTWNRPIAKTHCSFLLLIFLLQSFCRAFVGPCWSSCPHFGMSVLHWHGENRLHKVCLCD